MLEQWRIALGALRANWFRAVLTALGVVIGVASLIAVTAVSAGAKKEVADSIRRLGGNVIKVDGEFISIGTRQSATDRTITPEDVAAIERLPMVTAVAPHQAIESLTVSAGRNQTSTWLEGVTADYTTVQNQRSGARPSDLGFRRQLRAERHRARPGRGGCALPGREPDREDGAGGEPRVRGHRRAGPPRGARRRESRQPDLHPAADPHPSHPRRRQRGPRRRPGRATRRRSSRRSTRSPRCWSTSTSFRPATPKTSRPRTRRRSSRKHSGRPPPSGSSPSRWAGSRCSSGGSGS